MNGGDVNALIENLSWISWEIPHSQDPIIDTLSALNSLWEYQLSLTVFTLSFFVNHAYQSWRSGKVPLVSCVWLFFGGSLSSLFFPFLL